MNPDDRVRAAMRWGDALRARNITKSRLRRRGCAVVVLIGLLGATIALPPRPRLVWNASASVPIGLYRVDAAHDIATGDMVIARVPERWRSPAAERGYIPLAVPLVKRVAAAPGDTVCAAGQDIFVNGRWVAKRRIADGRGRPMPWWTGCATLRDGALFLMTDNPESFDGRYFGPTAHRDVIGRAVPLWLR